VDIEVVSHAEDVQTTCEDARIPYAQPVPDFPDLLIEALQLLSVPAVRQDAVVVEPLVFCSEMTLKLTRTLSYSGRSLVLRIPKDVEKTLKLKPGQKVQIWIEGKNYRRAIGRGF